MVNRKTTVIPESDIETKRAFIKSIKREYKLLSNYVSLVDIESLPNKM